ncbi:35172_t:CDS:2, partial [Gigaspora margarita]
MKQTKIKNLKLLQKAVYRARRVKNNLAHKEEIEKHINNRFNNFAQNTSKIIDKEVRKHYEKWIQTNPLNSEKWSEWATEYEPIQSIDPE